MNLSGDSEQLRLRHVLHCEKEEFETVRGKGKNHNSWFSSFCDILENKISVFTSFFRKKIQFFNEIFQIFSIFFHQKNLLIWREFLALYIADKEKERRNCKICGENYSNAMPTVEYSYFRRHAANHIIPDHIDGQQFYYKCFYCPERYKR